MTPAFAAGAVGTWVKLPTIESVQILAYTGWDFVVIDQEHAPIDDRTMYQLVSVAVAEGLTAFVRVDQLRGPTIQRVLDAGADGILVPHVDSAEDAEAAVRAARFPPRGTRGAGGTSRAGRWGMRAAADYLRSGNSEVRVIPQLESRLALDNASAIAAMDGVDAVFIGVADLALDMGLSTTDPAVIDRYLDALEHVHVHGKLCGFAAGTGEGAAEALARGFDFVMASSDTALLATSAADAVARARQQKSE